MKSNGSPHKRPTPRQAEWLDVIQNLKAARKYDPSYAEIAKAMGVGADGVFQMLYRLEKQGFIRRKPGAKRCIELVP